jgi:hypothetical protein
MRHAETRQQRFLAALETGSTIVRACKLAGVSRRTVERWRSRGRMVKADPSLAEFARRFDAAGRMRPTSAARPLTDAELAAVVEDAARRGSAESAKALLVERRREHRAQEASEELASDPWSKWLRGDPYVADELAARPDHPCFRSLTDEQREIILDGGAEADAEWADEAKADAGVATALISRRIRHEAAER